MVQLIDSSVFIALERRKQPLSTLATAISGGPMALASITASEMLAGVHRANTPERRLRRESFVASVLGHFPVVPFDLYVARTHAELWVHLATTGQLIGPHDLLIAATALAYGYAVQTHNLREFERVPGLTVRQPNWNS